MKRPLFFLLALLCGALGVAEVRAQAAGAYARMGFGARGVALSNALVADGFGDASPYYNPALAPFTARQHLEASAAFLSFDRELQMLQLGAPLRPRAGVAAGLVHAAVTGIDGRDASGYHTEDYQTDEFAFFLAFGTRIGGRASVGAGVQLFRADYFEGVDPVVSIGLDLGATYAVSERLRLGLAVDDLLARYAWDTSDLFDGGKTTTDRFPTRLRVGAAYAFADGRARVMGEYESRVTSREARTRQTALVGTGPGEVDETEDLRLQDNRFRLGVEYRLAEPFALRAGIDGLGGGDLAGAKPTAGFMVEQPVGRLVARAEYAFALEPYAVGTMHLVTLRVFL